MCSFLNVSGCFFSAQCVVFSAQCVVFSAQCVVFHCQFVYFSVSVWVQSEPFFRGIWYLVKTYTIRRKNDTFRRKNDTVRRKNDTILRNEKIAVGMKMYHSVKINTHLQ